MENIKAKLTAEPVNRPSYDEWVKEFNFGSLGKPLMEALGRSDKFANEKEMMTGYDFNKLKNKVYGH